MAIKTIIKRTIPKEKESELLPLLLELRSNALSQPGYISAETLRNIDNPEEFLVIGIWQSVDFWNAWKASKKRMEIQERIDTLLRRKDEISTYYYS